MRHHSIKSSGTSGAMPVGVCPDTGAPQAPESFQEKWKLFSGSETRQANDLEQGRTGYRAIPGGALAAPGEA